MIGEPPEKFLRGVSRALFADEFQRAERVFVPEFSRSTWADLSSPPNPSHAGRRASPSIASRDRRAVPRGELGFQFLPGLRFDVSRHDGSVVVARAN